jgi:hypothetical protein
VDKTYSKEFYSSIDVVKYFENIYARTFHGQQINEFSPELVENLQKIYSEYREGIMKIDQTY